MGLHRYRLQPLLRLLNANEHSDVGDILLRPVAAPTTTASVVPAAVPQQSKSKRAPSPKPPAPTVTARLMVWFEREEQSDLLHSILMYEVRVCRTRARSDHVCVCVCMQTVSMDAIYARINRPAAEDAPKVAPVSKRLLIDFLDEQGILFALESENPGWRNKPNKAPPTTVPALKLKKSNSSLQ